MRIGAALKTVRDARQHPIHPRGAGGDDYRGLGGFGERFGGGGIGGVARLGEVRPRDREKPGRAGTGDGVGGRLDGFADQPGDQLGSADLAGQGLSRGQGFERALGQGAVGFGVSQKENGFHGGWSPGYWASQAMISWAIWSGGVSLTIRVSRNCLGRETLA